MEIGPWCQALSWTDALLSDGDGEEAIRRWMTIASAVVAVVAALDKDDKTLAR
jgi:hypothetical protein